MDGQKKMILSVGLLLAAFWMWRKSQPSQAAPDYFGALSWSWLDDVQDFTSGVFVSATSAIGLEFWRAPEKYAGAILIAENANGIPARMLERLFYQECRYREDIITGAKSSPVGALGIAQLMPATAKELGVNPLDPVAAINAAGRYLKSLYRQTNDWGLALAAYNWGIGNVQRKGIQNAPKETRDYYRDILAAVGGAGSVLA